MTINKLKLPKYVSPHFLLSEVLFSETASRKGIENKIPTEEVLNSILHTASQMELVRTALGNNPIAVSSWYRNKEVNRAVGGATTSQHLKGEAVDFVCHNFGTPLNICRKIISSGISFDQLILEHSWVHISFKSPNFKNRNQVLSLLKSKKYAVGLTNKQGRKYS